jgi:DNA-binding ferritin-like protein
MNFELNQLANLAQLFLNDCQYVHWNCSGAHFDDIHNVARDYYYRLQVDIDWFIEKAISKGFAISNMTCLQQAVPPEVWQPESSSHYNMTQFIAFLQTKGLDYLEALKNSPQDESEIQSRIDDMINYWSTELEYKNTRRSEEDAEVTEIEQPGIPPIDYATDDTFDDVINDVTLDPTDVFAGIDSKALTL